MGNENEGPWLKSWLANKKKRKKKKERERARTRGNNQQQQQKDTWKIHRVNYVSSYQNIFYLKKGRSVIR